MPSPILARANALMQRRRGNNPEFDDVPLLTDAVSTDDEFPVLLELAPADTIDLVEDSVSEPVFDPLAAPEPANDLAETLSNALVLALADRIEQRLMAELPRIIEASVRDYLAEQAVIKSSGNQD